MEQHRQCQVNDGSLPGEQLGGGKVVFGGRHSTTTDANLWLPFVIEAVRGHMGPKRGPLTGFCPGVILEMLVI